MDNRGYIAVAVIALFIVGAIGGSYWYLTSSPTRDAFLKVEFGQVEVDSGSGWEPATDNMDLSLNAKVRTISGEAVIVLYESILVALESDTVVSLTDLAREHIKIDHSQGSAWHKFTGLMGITAFSVKTPNTVATVRGTEFGTGMESVIVGEGSVSVGNNTMGIGEKYVLEDGVWVKKPLSPEERKIVIENMKKTITRLKDLRMDEINKKPFLYNSVKKMYGKTDEEIQTLMLAMDAGEYDLDELEAKAPFESDVITKVRGLTEQIIKQNKLLKELQSSVSDE